MFGFELERRIKRLEFIMGDGVSENPEIERCGGRPVPIALSTVVSLLLRHLGLRINRVHEFVELIKDEKK